MSGVKINSLELENIKRIKAVKIEPTANGLTIIGGKNRQGKTSVLDSIAWALGGAKYRPENAQRDGSVLPPQLRIRLSNGLIVERDGKNSDLKVTDPQGRRHGQSLLNSFIDELALNLPKFLAMNDKDKAKTLLQILGIEEDLEAMEKQEQALYDKRHAIGQLASQKRHAAQEMPYFPEAPQERVSVSELIQEQQAILARNGENQRIRTQRERLENESKRLLDEIHLLEKKLSDLQDQLVTVGDQLEIARESAEGLKDESTAEIEESIRNIEEINQQVDTNAARQRTEQEAIDFEAQYDALTEEIEALRQDRLSLLDGAKMPLPELTVTDGVLVYRGQPWGNLASSEQLKVATAIIKSLSPECGFVLLDKLEQMDLETLQEFGEWTRQEGLQIIATRVSTGSECSLIIEDGYIKGQERQPMREGPQAPPEPEWMRGDF